MDTYEMPDEIWESLQDWTALEYMHDDDRDRRAEQLRDFLEELEPVDAEYLMRHGWRRVDDAAPPYEPEDDMDQLAFSLDDDNDDDDD